MPKEIDWAALERNAIGVQSVDYLFTPSEIGLIEVSRLG
jgi:hypothetical protein